MTKEERLKLHTVINNMSVGRVFVGYPELCRTLGVSAAKTTKMIERDLQEIQRYVRLDIAPRNVITVEEIYETPLPPIIDKRTMGNNTRYMDNLKLQVKHMLAMNPRGEVSFTKTGWFVETGMANERYKLRTEDGEYDLTIFNDLSQSTSLKNVSHFYMQTSAEMWKMFKRTLDSLKSSYLIDWTERWAYVETRSNENGTEYFAAIECNKQESELIHNAHRDVIESMGFDPDRKGEYAIQAYGRYGEMKGRLQHRLRKLLNNDKIQFAYKKINVSYTHRYVLDSISNDEKYGLCVEMNKINVAKLKKHLSNKAKNHERTCADEQSLLAFGVYESDKAWIYHKEYDTEIIQMIKSTIERNVS